MFISGPPSRGKDAVKIAVGFVSVKLAEVAAFGEGLPESFFDYGEVPEANRDELHQLTAGIKSATRRHLAVLAEIGERLLRAKEIAGHGNFLPWLAAEFSWSERTARMYMRVAEFFQGKTATFADLDLTTATALIKAPVEVRDEIMARADAGEVINKAEVKATLAARANHQPKSAANVLRVETTSRRLVVSTVRYVRDPDSAPVDPVTAPVRIVSRTERIATPAAAYGKDAANRIRRTVEELIRRTYRMMVGRFPTMFWAAGIFAIWFWTGRCAISMRGRRDIGSGSTLSNRPVRSFCGSAL